MKKILLIDTFNFLHRAFHALPRTFVDVNGEPVNAVYGVASMIINVMDQVKPQYIFAAIDGEKPTFRLESFTPYKAHRSAMDTDLSSQIPKVLELLDGFGIPRLQVDGYEADDIIGTLVTKYKKDHQVIVVSNDRDFWQLLDTNVSIMVPNNRKGEQPDWMDKDSAAKKLGFPPKLVADYKGLRGDPSDNIPGVYGIGEKTATKLIQDFGDLDAMYTHAPEIAPESLQKKLLENYEIAMQSRDLATIRTDVPLDFKLEDAIYDGFEKRDIIKVLQRYNFKSLIRRLGYNVPTATSTTSTPDFSDGQLSLF